MNGAFRLGVAAAAIRSGGVEPGPTDPLFGNVVSLLHFDGPDQSTSFSDVKGITWSITSGSPKIVTAQAKFGGASGAFSGTDRITAGLPVPIPAGTIGSTAGDFCIECWARVTDLTQLAGILHLLTGAASVVGQLGIHSNGVFVGASTNVRLSSAPSLNTWYHLALTRNERSARLFLDGVQQGAAFNSTGGSGTSNAVLYVGNGPGGLGAGASFQGWIDDVRVTIGAARYTASFMPPVAPFPNS